MTTNNETADGMMRKVAQAMAADASANLSGVE
jgi:hypothetical protein